MSQNNQSWEFCPAGAILSLEIKNFAQYENIFQNTNKKAVYSNKTCLNCETDFHGFMWKLDISIYKNYVTTGNWTIFIWQNNFKNKKWISKLFIFWKSIQFKTTWSRSKIQINLHPRRFRLTIAFCLYRNVKKF